MVNRLREAIENAIDTGSCEWAIIEWVTEEDGYKKEEVIKELAKLVESDILAVEYNDFHDANFYVVTEWMPGTAADIKWNKKYGDIGHGDKLKLKNNTTGIMIEVVVEDIKQEGRIGEDGSATIIRGAIDSKKKNEYTAIVYDNDNNSYNLEDYEIISRVDSEDIWDKDGQCRNCGFKLDKLQTYTYIKRKSDGQAIPITCPGAWKSIALAFDNPSECRMIPRSEIAKMGGVMTEHVCMNCQNKFGIDIGEVPDAETREYIHVNQNPVTLNARECPSCHSHDVKNLKELTYGDDMDKYILTCPKCKKDAIIIKKE